MSLIHLSTELRQELKLTPQLLQSMELLQMNSQELLDYLNQVSEENPLVEQTDLSSLHKAYEALRQKVHWINGGLPEDGHGAMPDRGAADRETESLSAFLCDQLERRRLPKPLLALTRDLAELVDEEGRLSQEDLDGVAELKIPQALTQQALETLQSLDPAGVGARSLSECLLLQLRKSGKLTPLLERLIKSHLVEFETRTPAAIARDMGISLAQLGEALDVIRSCNPRPASQFGRPSRPIWPEVVVTSCDDGTYEVSLQDFYLPHLKINPTYRAMASHVKEHETETYLSEKLKEAESLIDGINFRHATLYKVACCMVQMQVEFFERGYDCLRPLTMAQVAEATGVSESTVSRISNGNYMQTPRGVFELRFFFHSSAYQGADRVVSSVSVKHRIGELVDREDPSNPLSDQAISEALEREGVSVSRRTVNKYREELGIPARAARRRS